MVVSGLESTVCKTFMFSKHKTTDDREAEEEWILYDICSLITYLSTTYHLFMHKLFTELRDGSSRISFLEVIYDAKTASFRA